MSKTTQPYAAAPESGGEPAHKKPRLTPCETVKDLDTMIASLQTQKQQLTEELLADVQTKWRDLRSGENTSAYLLNTDYRATDWTCVACTTDFTPMLLANTSEKALDLLYHCEACGGATCYKCTVRLLTRNARNDKSVGAQCPVCRFYNCNLVKKSVTPRPPVLAEMAFPSGYSTVAPAKVKGEKLPTSAATTSNETHATNLQERQEVFDLLTENGNEDHGLLRRFHDNMMRNLFQQPPDTGVGEDGTTIRFVRRGATAEPREQANGAPVDAGDDVIVVSPPVIRRGRR